MENKIYNHLLDIGCCKYCSLRYLQDRCVDFSNIDGYIEKKKLTDADNVVDTEPIIKQRKRNPCSICLGLLQDHVMDEVVDKILISEVQKYDTKVFTCSISIPAATIIREHAIRLDLQNRYPEFYLEERERNCLLEFSPLHDLNKCATRHTRCLLLLIYRIWLWTDIEEIPLNKAWKLIIKEKLSSKLNIAFENSDICNFSINIIMDYADNQQELLVMKKLAKANAKNGELCGRKSILNILSNCLPEKFQEVVKTPLNIPSAYLTCKQIECKHNSTYLAGRYCKFTRELSQSPWFVDGVKTMETSVEEIIFEQINQVFNIPSTNLKFSASGREDCDVRCLGKGRPFYIEILDPKKTLFSYGEFRQLETNINCSKLIKVRDLQSVQRNELTKVKEGEQLKTKDYIALCLTRFNVSQDQINKINTFGEVTLEQKTPIRVLHRRPLAIRRKKVYHMEASLVCDKPNLFQLSLVTEAGTYVKEFVHGDFGRTKPSIGDIINSEVDIIALDVIAINLDWPKEVEIKNTNSTMTM